ncbi:MAG: TorF family putative porin [Shimia sp.]|uniref:TorF family putative porin n=1 Tax=Shimia sp. TaxID=1954381 RepID=UPI00405A3368
MKLRTSAAIAALVAPMIAAGGASAQGFTWNYGVDFTTNYISDGVSQSDGSAAIQPWVEAAFGNFYVGTWMSNVDFGVGDENVWETDLYFGYRNSINDALSYDVGYTRYFYDATGNDMGEIIGQLTYSPVSTLDLTARVAYDHENENWNYRGEVGFAVTDAIALDAAYGHSDFYDHKYWAVGGSYAISDATAARISYNGSDTEDEGWAAMLSFAF